MTDFGKRLIYDTDAQHSLVALARQRGSDFFPLDMITYILFNDRPAVEAKEVVHAKWIKQWHDNNLIGHEYEECPICGCMISDTEKFWDCKFCPNCGAFMDGE
jgi:ribosomal protein S27AE